MGDTVVRVRTKTEHQLKWIVLCKAWSQWKAVRGNDFLSDPTAPLSLLLLLSPSLLSL